jgi:hypothetical protein
LELLGVAALQREPTATNGRLKEVQFNTFLHATRADVCVTLIFDSVVWRRAAKNACFTRHVLGRQQSGCLIDGYFTAAIPCEISKPANTFKHSLE